MKKTSPIDSLDPRIRVVLALLLSLETALLSHLQALLPLLLCALILLVIAKPAANDLVRRLCTVNVFIAFLWLFIPWTTPGTPAATLCGLEIHNEGLCLATLITIKANTIALFCLALISSMTTTTVGHALRSLHVSEQLVFLLLFAERSLALLRTEWRHLNEAATLRGFTPRFSLHTYKTLAALLAILLLRSVDHAKRSQEALMLRNFQGVFFVARTQSIKPFDMLASTLILLVMGVSIGIQQSPLF
ncbi:MAG: cobalt ECF transporter T component CbiQ [Desulfovibrio sp.]|nr:cobalt ECF transporter T component CbiQ [Desulfovibrio sp.]